MRILKKIKEEVAENIIERNTERMTAMALHQYQRLGEHEGKKDREVWFWVWPSTC